MKRLMGKKVLAGLGLLGLAALVVGWTPPGAWDSLSGVLYSVTGLSTSGILTLVSSGAGVTVTTDTDAGDDFAVNTDALVVEGDTDNVGMGVAAFDPWGDTYSALQLGGNVSLMWNTTKGAGSEIEILNNGYWNGTNYKYQSTDEASLYYQKNGEHFFRSAASGTAGDTITWSTILHLDANKNIGVGITPAAKFHVKNDTADAYVFRFQASDGGELWNMYELASTRPQINLYDASGNITVQVDGAGFMVFAPAASDNVIAAATGVTDAMIRQTIRVAGNGGNIDITANPQIVDGSNGQRLLIQGTSDTDTVQFDDANGLQLAGGASFTLGLNDVLQLMYDSGEDLWIEISRSDN